MMTFRVRLSRTQSAVPISMVRMTRMVTQTRARQAKMKPIQAKTMSLSELRMLSPTYPSEIVTSR